MNTKALPEQSGGAFSLHNDKLRHKTRDADFWEMRMRWAALVISALSAQTAWAGEPKCHGRIAPYHPPSGIVGNAMTATSVARTYLTAVYGAEQLRGEEPLAARLRDDVWVVQGSLRRGVDGGAAIIRICRRNGRVLSIIHEK